MVESPFGYHIIKVTGEAKPQTKEFELVKKEIEEKLLLEKKSEYFEKLTEKLKNKAGLDIRIELLSAFQYETKSSDE